MSAESQTAGTEGKTEHTHSLFPSGSATGWATIGHGSGDVWQRPCPSANVYGAMYIALPGMMHVASLPWACDGHAKRAVVWLPK